LLEQYAKRNSELAEQLKKTNGVTDAQVESYKRVIKNLAKVDSGTMSTTQQQKALETQLKELKIQWNSLSEAAKNSDFGKSMSASMKSAQEQLQQLRTQMRAAQDEIEKSDGKVKKLSGTMSGEMLTSIKSLIGKFAVLATAQQVFDRLVNSNQESADSFAGYVYAAKSAVDHFFYSISTGDFTVFYNGLENLIGRARAAAAAIDQLGNTVMSYNVINAKAQSKIKAARAVLYDEDATKEQKEQAIKDLQAAYKEIGDAAEIVVADAGKRIRKEVEAMSNISLGEKGAIDLIDYWLEMDAKEGREEYKEKAEKQYKEYEKAMADVVKKHSEKRQSTTSFGMVITTDVITDIEGYTKDVEALNETFKDAVVYNALLKKATDEQLNNLGQNRIAMIQYADATSDAAVQTGKLTKQLNTQLKSGKPTVITSTENKVTRMKLDIEPIKLGVTEKELKDKIADLKKKIENTPEGVLRIQLESNLKELEDQLKDFGKTPIQKEIELKATDLDLSGVKGADMSGLTFAPVEIKGNALDELQNLNSASQSLYNTWRNLDQVLDDTDANAADKFFAITDTIFTTIDSIQKAVEGFQALIKVIQQVQAVENAFHAQKIANSRVEQAESLRNISTTSTETVMNVTKEASKTPWPATLAAVVAAVAAITAIISSIKGFSSGGIVNAKSTIGDYNLIRVNGNEAVLNTRQQARLWRILNGELNTGNGDSNVNG